MNEGALYLDASALVKLVLAEAETDALIAYLAAAQGTQVTSAISGVELPRAARRARVVDPVRVQVVLERVGSMAVDADVIRRAASLDPPGLRSLDAIHLASAIGIRADLQVFVTYDQRLADAARSMGFEVAAPA